MERAVAYLRVSTEEQVKQGVSLAAQEERVQAYCQMADLDLVATIREEGISGSKPLATLPGGAELLKLVARKDVKHVVALKLDRLFRDAADALIMTKNWDKAGVALHLIDMGGQTLNTASPMGRFFLSMTASFAELERNLISERTTMAMAHKKSHREVYAPIPYGFDRNGDALAENHQELKTVSQIRKWRAEGWTLGKISMELTKRQIPTKKGGGWYPGTVKYLLDNSLYEGVMA